MLIEEIRVKVASGNFEFTQHAVDQSLLRQITVNELREAVSTGEVIEDYPQDKYGPSCLLLGFTQAGRPMHIQCSHPSRLVLKIIKLYEPDTNQWINFRQRRP